MSNQLQITGGAKVRALEGVITGTSGVLSSVPLGAANGVATLDSGGKVPVSQLPSSVVTYLGTWNAATNTPTLTNGTGDAGDMYICNVAGTVNFGAGPVSFAVGDWVLYGSGTWQKSNGQNGTVTSVGATITGGAIGITGSPITTAGTLAFAFAGTSGQYVNGAGNLTTFPSLTGYVPYTGATNDLNLGTHNLYANNIFDGFINVAASGSQIVLTIASTPSYTITGSGGQTIKLPDATTLPNGAIFSFNNNQSSGAITINNNSNTLVVSVPSGGFAEVVLLDNSIAAGSWDRHFKAPSNVSWSTNTLDYAGSITSATWNGNVVAINRGGTGSSTQNFVDLTTTQTIGGAKTFSSSLTASSLIKTGGTSSQFLKADGSVDSSSYITLASLSFAAGSGAYNSTTGVITIPTNNTQITNGANYITLASLSAGVGISYNNTTGVITSTITQYTDALARAAISLTTTGTSGAATYNSTTGVLNIPQYIGGVTSVFGRTGAVVATEGDYTLTQLGDVTITSPTTGQALKYNGTGWVNGTDTDTGITTLNTLTALTQTFAVGTSGTDFAISSATSTHTFNLPTASATNRGALSSSDWSTFNGKESVLTFSSPLVRTTNTISIPVATTSVNGYLSSTDWTTFNNKQGAITLTTTGTSGAATFSSNTLNIPNYGSGAVTGSGTTNYLPKFTGASTIGNSLVYDNGTRVGINTASISDTTLTIYDATANGDILKLQTASTKADIWFVDSGTTSGALRIRGEASSLKFITGSAIRMTLTDIGNLGLGVTPSAWNSIYKVAEIGTAAIFGTSSYNSAAFSTNVFYNSANSPRYIASDFSNMYWQDDGNHIWYNAPSGTAGNAITFTQAMTLDASGKLGIGIASPLEKLDINGALVVRGSTVGYNSAVGVGMLDQPTTGITRLLSFGPNTSTFGSYQFYIAGANNTNGYAPMTLFANGNLAVGTTTDAGYKLDVNGTGRFSGNLTLTGSGGYTEQDFVYGGITKTSLYWENGTSTFNYYTTGTHKFTQAAIFSSSVTAMNLFVYTTGQTLQIKPSSASENYKAGLYTSSTDNEFYMYTTSLTQTVKFLASSGNAFFNGTLGLGTSTVGSKFQVNGNAAIGYSASTAAPTNGLAVSGNTLIGTTDNSLAKALVVYSGTADSHFAVAGTAPSIRFVSATTSPTYSALFGMATATSNYITGSAAGDFVITWNSANKCIFGFSDTSTGKMAIASSGNLLVGTLTDVATAILQLSSTTKGFLPPVMTTTQKNAISSPATGLVVFDSTLGKLCVFSSTWQTITSV